MSPDHEADEDVDDNADGDIDADVVIEMPVITTAMFAHMEAATESRW